MWLANLVAYLQIMEQSLGESLSLYCNQPNKCFSRIILWASFTFPRVLMRLDPILVIHSKGSKYPNVLLWEFHLYCLSNVHEQWCPHMWNRLWDWTHNPLITGYHVKDERKICFRGNVFLLQQVWKTGREPFVGCIGYNR